MTLRLVSGGSGAGGGSGTGDGNGGDDGSRREGRGWLHTIDTLPEECNEDVAWLVSALRARKMTQTEILRQFNERITAKGQDPISKGSFSRYSVARAADDRKDEAARAVTELVLARYANLDRSDSIVAATEFLKVQIVQLLCGDEPPSIKDINNAALVLSRLSRTAILEQEHKRREQRAERIEATEGAEREQAEREKAEREQAAADAENITRIAQEAGLGAERIAAIRRGVLGLAT